MKKLLSFIAVSALTFSSLSAQEADMRIGELINSADWFALEEEYPVIKGSVQTPFLKVLAEVMIANNFNRPDEALQKINELLSSYQQEIGFDNTSNMVALASLIYGQSGDYAEAADNIYGFISQLKGQGVVLDFSNYENLYNYYNELRHFPAPQMSRPNEDVVIPVSIEPVKFLKQIDVKKDPGLQINIPVKVHDRNYKFIFDTGAANTYMSEKFAKEAGVKILKDSLLINQGMMGESYGMQGFLDSLQVGDIVFRNVMVTIGRFNAADSVVRTDAVLGMDFIKSVGEVQIDVKNKQIIFPVNRTPLPATGRNLLLTNGNRPILKAYSGADRLSFFFDTGNNKADLFYSYYNKYKNQIDLEAKKDSLTGGGIGYVRKKEILIMPSVKFNVGETVVKTNEIFVHPVAENDQTQEDGNLGMDIIMLFDKTIINSKDMFVKFE